MQKGSVYRPKDHGKVDFYGKVNPDHATFAHPSTFKTVFISGDDMVAEEARDKAKEKQAWHDKVVVKSTHFGVNTRSAKSHQMDKFKSIRQGDAVKVGIQLHDTKLKKLKNRQITTNKYVQDPPVSMMALHEEYRANEQEIQASKVLDMNRHCLNHDGTLQNRDFLRYTRQNTLSGK